MRRPGHNPKELGLRIIIDNQRVADIEVTAMYLRPAYVKIGLVPPDDDLYADILPDDLARVIKEIAVLRKMVPRR